MAVALRKQAVAAVAEVSEGLSAELLPVLNEEMVEQHIQRNTRKATSPGAESLPDLSFPGMGVSKFIYQLVIVQAAFYPLGQLAYINAFLKVTQQIAVAGICRGLCKVKVSEIVHPVSVSKMPASELAF